MKKVKSGGIVFLILIGLLSIPFVSAATASDSSSEIEPLNESNTRIEVSDLVDTVRIVNVTSDIDSDGTNEMVNESILEASNYEINFIYNSTGGTAQTMSYLNNGYYYIEGQTSSSLGQYGTYEINKTENGNTIDNWTQQLDIGNMTAEIQTDLSSSFDPSETVKFNVSVEDAWNNTNEDQADVDVYFTNVTWRSDIYELNNYNNGFYYNSQVNIPPSYGEDYVLHANVSKASGATVHYQNPYGSNSRMIETTPEIAGKIQTLETDAGCNNQSFFRECEREANLSTEYEVTENSANSVNVEVRLWDKNNNQWTTEDEVTLNNNSGTYSGNIQVPDVNTSDYKDTVQLLYNASNSRGEDIDKYNITYRSYKISYKGASVTSPGDYKAKIEFSKYFTPTPLNGSRISGEVNITEPDGGNFTDFDIADMNYDESEGIFKKTLGIESDAETGIYDIQIDSHNIHFDEKSLDASFKLLDIEQTFKLGTTDIEKDYNKTRVYSTNLSVENVASRSVNLSTNITDDLSDVVEIKDLSKLSISEGDTENVTLDFNITRVEEYSGEIKFMDNDSDYNQTVEIDVLEPNCDYRSDTVCISTDGLNASTDKSGNLVKYFDLKHIGEPEIKSFSPNVTGNVSEFIELDPEAVSLGEYNDTENVTINYSAISPGYFTGSIEIGENDTVNVPIELDSNVTSSDISVDLPSSIDLGYLEEEGTKSSEIQIENTGNTNIESIEFSSTVFDISADTTSLSVGEEKTIDLQFSQVSSESGTVTVDLSSAANSTIRTISVSANPVPNYNQEADQLSQRLQELDSQIEQGSDLQSQLESAQSTIQEIKTAYNNENYQRAQSLYNRVQATVNDIESQASSSSSSNSDTPSQEDGGSGVAMLFLFIFLLIIIGFVAYTSIIPEEGDPMYNVLGQ